MDVSGHGFTGCVGNIVERQYGHMIAHTDPAVFAAICPNCPAGRVHDLPAFCLQIMDVHVFSPAYRRDESADVVTVFHDGFAEVKIP
jgi:hypothetical protein